MEISYKHEDLKEVAKAVISKCTHNIILMYGQMGVGKTTLTKALVNQLGINSHTVICLDVFHFLAFGIENLMV